MSELGISIVISTKPREGGWHGGSHLISYIYTNNINILMHFCNDPIH